MEPSFDVYLARMARLFSYGYEKGNEEFTFAIPAGTFGVYFIICFLVGGTGPFEGDRKSVLIYLIIVVDEFLGRCYRIVVVLLGTKLVRVPCEINIKRRYCCLCRMKSHDREKSPVLDYKSLHGCLKCWTVKPVNIVHLIDKCALAYDSTSKV